jgi:drug/metabolite transporter (DMT)-like permease
MGEIAAIFTALSWGVASIFFTSSSRESGAILVNRVRLLFAVPLLILAHLFLTGQVLPLGAASYRWLWLSLSGVVGLVAGDTLLFLCYSLIGNRLGTLIMASVPVISSLEAFFFLGEKLDQRSVLGIMICVAGIALVVVEGRFGGRNGGRNAADKLGAPETPQFLLGVLCGIGAALGQASGLVLAKQGLEGDFPAISGTLIRMLASLIVIWGIAILAGQFGLTLRKTFSSFRLASTIFYGSLIGSFIGIWLSQVAIQSTYVGIASTLMALTPVFLLPIAHWYYRENVSLRAIIGTLISLLGVALIFL